MMNIFEYKLLLTKSMLVEIENIYSSLILPKSLVITRMILCTTHLYPVQKNLNLKAI